MVYINGLMEEFSKELGKATKFMGRVSFSGAMDGSIRGYNSTILKEY